MNLSKLLLASILGFTTALFSFCQNKGSHTPKLDKDARLNSDTIANTAKGEHLNDSLKFITDLKEMLRSHADSVISINYTGGNYEISYQTNITRNETDSITDTSYLHPIVWDNTYSITLKKKMITSANVKESAKIISDVVTDCTFLSNTLTTLLRKIIDGQSFT